MIRFLLTSVTGWTAVMVAGVEVALPYILRRAPRKLVGQKPKTRTSIRSPNFLARMWPHYWLGYALTALGFVHSTFVMGPAMARMDAIGIWAATLALGTLVLQISLGLTLKGEVKSAPVNRQQLRRWHFWSMLVFMGLVLAHVIRNG